MTLKLAGVVFAVSTLHTSVVQALGLGDIELKSSLNQPLRAEIAVLNASGIDPDQLAVRLAGKEAFDAAGVERVIFLSDLRFTVKLDERGNGLVSVSSEKMVREPFLDFVLEARWPDGRLVREYTLLVDLPAFDNNVLVSEPQAATTSAVRGRIPAPVETSAANLNKPLASGEVLTRPNDTLWEIAAKVKPAAVNIQQAMMAILRGNPDAFDGQNINGLRKGMLLTLPDEAEYRALTADQAIAAAGQQNAAWRSGATTGMPSPDSVATRPPATASGDSGYLKLSGRAADAATPEASAAESGRSAAEQQSAAELQAKMTEAEERIDRAERENAEMNSRIDELQQQIETLVQLVELKDQQLSGSVAGNPVAGSPVAGSPVAGIPVDNSAVTAQPGGQPVSADAPLAGAEEATAASSAAAVAAAPRQDMNYHASSDSGAPVDVAMPAPQRPAVEDAPATTGVDTMASGESSSVGLQAIMLSAAAGLIALLGGSGIVVMRRRRREEAALLAEEQAAINEEARASLKARAVGATAEAGSVVDADALLADDDNSEALFTALSAVVESRPDSTDTVWDADIVSDAEAHALAGRHDEAIALLQQGLAAEPARSELHMQLLGLYAEQGDEQAFKSAFAELERSGDQDAAFMARHLVADRGWLDDAPAGVHAAGEPVSLADPIDGGFDFGASEAGHGSADLSSAATLELDLDINLDDLANLDLNLDGNELGNSFNDNELSLDLEVSSSTDAEGSIDLGGLNVDKLGDAPASIDELLDAGDALDDEMQGMLEGDAIGTKLDLARAYVDMGDAEGARDILEEVLSEGSDGQKQEANQLLDTLAG